MFSKTLFVN